jgi:hypothetical protein
MSIKDACRPRASVTTRLSKERCVSIAVGGRPFALHINMIKIGVVHPQPEKHTPPRQVY